MAGTNQVMLITYPDSLGADLQALGRVLRDHFAGAVKGLHILPFFPSSADRGFAPTTYETVDPAFGDWADIRALGADYDLMCDFMVNHLSAHSAQYQDFCLRGDESAYRDLFLRYRDFWPTGEPTSEQIDKIYKRKPRAPYVWATHADGAREKVWSTFDEEQIDLNLESDAGRAFVRETLVSLAGRGVKIIRLDAFAYAIKRAGGSCFFEEPGIWSLLDWIEATLKPLGVCVLPEIHEHYTIQRRIAERGYPVYDFALPMLLLNALYFGHTAYLKHWLSICPTNAYTTLDTHDGIGVVDVKDLLPDDAIRDTREHLYRYGANVKKAYSTGAYNNLDIYQINCTYYSALGEDDQKYLLARAVQFFWPGTPQVYYVGALAGKNDIALLEKTKIGRNINRHYYTEEEIDREAARPVVRALIELMRFRNACPAFDGAFSAPACGDGELILEWRNGVSRARLTCDFDRCVYRIET